jgi:hypothetical protein
VLNPAPLRARVERWLNDRPDDAVLKWVLRGTLTATVMVLALDFVELNARVQDTLPTMPAYGPVALPDNADEPGAAPVRRLWPRKVDTALTAAMTFDLQADGRLVATGTIQPGTAKAFAAEIEKRGGYVKTIVLHSPGGSVSDALEMGRLIRARSFATEVGSDRYCASSCPLVFAGGVERDVGAKATIGVHQVTAVGPAGGSPAQGMDSVQRVAAECQRYLHEMGIDPQVWLHAMETPRDALHVFKADELIRLKLATERNAAPAAAPAATAKAAKKS